MHKYKDRRQRIEIRSEIKREKNKRKIKKEKKRKNFQEKLCISL